MLIVLEFFILNWYETQSQNEVGDSFSFYVSIIPPVCLSILMFFFLKMGVCLPMQETGLKTNFPEY